MKNSTLLEKAKSVRLDRAARSPFDSDERMTLAVAWAKGEISYKQVGIALYGKANQMTAYTQLAQGLREAVRQGILK